MITYSNGIKAKSVLYPDITYYLKQKVITENLYGVDILEEATEITRLQLLLALFTSIHTPDQIRPLSDISFNISAGNSLIGLLRLEDYPYKYVRHSEALANLDKLLLDQINNPLLKKLNKKARNKQTFEDIKPLKPFHWGYKFGQIMNEHGGFDVIITDPPWKILRSLDQYSNFLRSNPQYEYQGVENLNLYKLFVERCYKLLCDDGQCGILVPSGIVSDYSTQQHREMLFNKTCITSLFTFENRRHILSGVDSRFKFALLTFDKGGSTKTFPASFNRFNVEELTYFPSGGSISIPVTLIRRLSPDICAIAEFRSTIDMQICEKMARYPFLDERMDDRWNVVLTQDIHMTHNHRILHTEPGADYLPLYEGKMIQWQFVSFVPQKMGMPTPRTITSRQIKLEKDGSNIAEYLLDIRRLDNSVFESIASALQYVLPYSQDLQVEFASELQRSVYLQLTEGKFKVPGWLLSTGTLRIVALLALLRHPEPPPLIVIEEIENGLDPSSVHLIVEEIRSAVESGRTQIIMTTHSPYLLDLLSLSHIVLVERVNGQPTFTRPGDQEELQQWAKRFSLGSLYTTGKLSGAGLQ